MLQPVSSQAAFAGREPYQARVMESIRQFHLLLLLVRLLAIYPLPARPEKLGDL